VEYNQGWSCPNCGSAHSPDVKTCPVKQVTTTSPYAPYYPSMTQPKTCWKCFMPMEGAMGYVCPHLDCPTFLQVTSKVTYPFPRD
jgi:hypothetical protein